MITVEQHQNLSNHINFARTDIETNMTKEPTAANGEFLDLIIDAEQHLSEVQDIIDFLAVGNGSNNKIYQENNQIF